WPRNSQLINRQSTMFPHEQPLFFALVQRTLGEYVKTPTTGELEAWWATCRRFSFADVGRALQGHSEDPDDGKRAPRPVDVRRRLMAGTMERAAPTNEQERILAGRLARYHADMIRA